jgi:hypothetical protein
MSATGRGYGDRVGGARRSAPPIRRSAGHPLLNLQRQVGNQAVAGLFAQREGDDEELQMARDPGATIQREGEEDELQMARDPGAVVQREGDEELQMSRDPAAVVQREGEEDELQMSRDPAIQREGEEDELQMARDPAIQREGDEEELQMSRDSTVQRAGAEVGLEGGPLSDATASQIQAMRGGGAPLDGGTRSAMEGSFGTGFGDVRVHTGAEASDVSRRIGALAFTTGNDVFMRDDAYQPGTPDAQRLLGHELTHVVQQRTMSPSGDGGMQVGPAGDAYEQAADVKGAEVAASAPAQRETGSI